MVVEVVQMVDLVVLVAVEVTHPAWVLAEQVDKEIMVVLVPVMKAAVAAVKAVPDNQPVVISMVVLVVTVLQMTF